MLRKRDDSDPFESRRRQLEQQERLLSEQRRRLRDLLEPNRDATPKRAEPLVWRSEDESSAARVGEPTPARKGNLGRQRRRDMIAVFGLIILFLIVLGLVIWVAYVHNTSPGGST